MTSGPTDDVAAAQAELMHAIAVDVLAEPDLAGSDWETYALVVEVSADREAFSAYRYAADGTPTPTRVHGDFFSFADLWELSRGDDGTTWDVVVVKAERATSRVAMEFLSGADADRLRITPDNVDVIPGRLRPRNEDF